MSIRYAREKKREKRERESDKGNKPPLIPERRNKHKQPHTVMTVTQRNMIQRERERERGRNRER